MHLSTFSLATLLLAPAALAAPVLGETPRHELQRRMPFFQNATNVVISGNPSFQQVDGTVTVHNGDTYDQGPDGILHKRPPQQPNPPPVVTSGDITPNHFPSMLPPHAQIIPDRNGKVPQFEKVKGHQYIHNPNPQSPDEKLAQIAQMKAELARRKAAKARQQRQQQQQQQQQPQAHPDGSNSWKLPGGANVNQSRGGSTVHADPQITTSADGKTVKISGGSFSDVGGKRTIITGNVYPGDLDAYGNPRRPAASTSGGQSAGASSSSAQGSGTRPEGQSAGASSSSAQGPGSKDRKKSRFTNLFKSKRGNE